MENKNKREIKAKSIVHNSNNVSVILKSSIMINLS